ncbi:MAG: hypothetical protein KAG14_03325, partial [Mycoplasmataceae bacterium]|nr:hypothetical protein [Mycoplasmataceae bacterium]
YLKLNQGIVSTINMFSYLDLSELSIFDFFLEIFVKLLIGHYLTNGNKRMALTFLKVIMWEFGYYLKFTEGVWKNYNKHRTVIEEFAMGLETNGNDELQTKTKKDIKSSIEAISISAPKAYKQDDEKNFKECIRTLAKR